MPGIKGFRYVRSSTQVTKVLEKIRTTRRPEKVTFPYLRDTWLLKNKQYSDVITLLKDMNFLTSANVPTELYAEYQNPTRAKKVLAQGIQNAYPQLYAAFHNPQSLPKEELEGYFIQQTGASSSVIEKTLSTFRTLCTQADFTGVEVAAKEPVPEHKETEVEEKRRVKVEPRIQLNIEIHIAPDTPDDKIKKIFENMKNYLLPNE